MSSVLLDTNALYWYLFDPGKLTSAADNAIQNADVADQEWIYYSVISLAELLYLVEKGKFSANVFGDTVKVVTDPTRSFRSVTIDMPLVLSMSKIPRSIVPDLPDRIIATSGLIHSLPVVTSDTKIRNAPIHTIW